MNPTRSPIRRVLREYRLPLALTYVLFALEMVGVLARPYFLGAAVDGLLAGQWAGLMQLVAVHLTWLVIGVLRHVYDTRTFSSVYTTFITQLLDRSSLGVDVSRRSAYSSLSREVIEFLQYDLIYVIEAVYNILGSLIILAFYDRTVVAICLAALVPVSALSLVYGKRTAELNVRKHDELERQVHIIAADEPARIRDHYDNLRHWQVALSNQEAWNFGANEAIVILVLAASLYASTALGGNVHQAGALIALYSYVLRFTTGLDTIPYIIQRLAALRDILRRVNRVETPVSP